MSNQQFAVIISYKVISFKLKTGRISLFSIYKLSTKWTTQDSTLHMLMIY